MNLLSIPYGALMVLVWGPFVFLMVFIRSHAVSCERRGIPYGVLMVVFSLCYGIHMYGLGTGFTSMSDFFCKRNSYCFHIDILLTPFGFRTVLRLDPRVFL